MFGSITFQITRLFSLENHYTPVAKRTEFLSHTTQNKVHSQAGSQLGTCLALCFVRMLIIFITLKTKTIRTQNQTKPHFCVSSSLNSSDLSNIQLWRRSGFSSFSRCFSFPLRSCKVSISDLDSFQTELVGVSKNFIW